MRILYLESSSKNCSVAVSENHEILCSCDELSDDYKQSEKLHLFVEWALEGAQLSLKDIECVVLGMGPGSYTGLRIGAASAKGFCFGNEIPLVAVNSLESMIEPFLNQNYDVIIPLVDARRMEVYTAAYDGKTGKCIEDTQALILDEESFKKWNDKNVLFVGDGCTKAQTVIALEKAEFQSKVYPSAKYLVRKAMEKIQKKEFEDVAYFELFYLKDFHGVKKK